MVAYPFMMPSGIAGNVSRENPTIEPQIFDTATPPTSYGVPVKLVSGKIQPIASGDAATVIYGMLVRPYPTSGNGVDGLGTATPNTKLPADVLKRGYINVVCGGTTAPAKGGAVYVRVAAAATGKPIGGIEAASDSTNTVLMAGAYFTGGRDANNNAEIAFNI